MENNRKKSQKMESEESENEINTTVRPLSKHFKS